MAYCTRTHLDNLLGADNVAKYADRDNDASSATIDATVAAAIAAADALIDGLFRDGPYAVPFSPVPALVADWSARLAAFRLYHARGLNDQSDTTAGQMRHLHEQTLAEIRPYVSGVQRLELDPQHDGPTGPVGVR